MALTRLIERIDPSPEARLERRTLGQVAVSGLGLGCMGMSAHYGRVDEREAVATIRRAVALGCTFFDTAEFYGPFANEELLGERSPAGAIRS